MPELGVECASWGWDNGFVAWLYGDFLASLCLFPFRGIVSLSLSLTVLFTMVI